jgi:hypothetical protein
MSQLVYERDSKKPIYVSTSVFRALWLLSKAEGIPEEGRIVTPDEIADQILRQAIREQHPTLAEHQKKINDMEKVVIDSLRK